MQVMRTRIIPITKLTEDHLSIPEYQPAKLLDMLHEVLGVVSDAKLAYQMQVDPCIISKLRRRRGSLTPAILLRMHDVSGLTIDSLRDLAGIPRPNFG